LEESSSFSEEKEPKRLLLRFASMCHRQRDIKRSKVFLLLFVHKKKYLLAFFLAFCVLCDLALSRANIPNSDVVQSFNEMCAVLHGNVLLHHWVLSADNFYFTDLPLFIIGGALTGSARFLIYLVPVIVFSLLLLAALRLAAAPGAGRFASMAAILFLIGIPFGPLASFMLGADIHIATIALCLWAMVCAQPALSRQPFRRWRLLPFSLAIFAIAASDPLGDVICIAPFCLLVGLRFWLGMGWWRDEWLVLACTIAATVLGILVISLLSHNGGFTMGQTYSLDFVNSVHDMKRDASAVLAGVQILFNARLNALGGVFLAPLLAGMRLVTMGIVLALCLLVLWRLPRAPQSFMQQWLVLGAVCLFATNSLAASFHVAVVAGPGFPGASVRYVTPVFIFTSCAAVLEGRAWLSSGCRWLPPKLFWPLAACCLAINSLSAVPTAAYAARQPAGYLNAPQANLSTWLYQHHFTYGVGDYWTAGMVNALTKGNVSIDPVYGAGGELRPFRWLGDMARFDAHRRPQFVVYSVPNLFSIDMAGVTASYGPAQQVFQVERYTVVQFQAP
jgi:hypothetical protein